MHSEEWFPSVTGLPVTDRGDSHQLYQHLLRCDRAERVTVCEQLNWGRDRLDRAVAVLSSLEMVVEDETRHLFAVAPECVLSELSADTANELARSLDGFALRRSHVERHLAPHAAHTAEHRCVARLAGDAYENAVGESLHRAIDLDHAILWTNPSLDPPLGPRTSHAATVASGTSDDGCVVRHALISDDRVDEAVRGGLIDRLHTVGFTVRRTSLRLAESIVLAEHSVMLRSPRGDGGTLVTDPVVVEHSAAVFDCAWAHSEHRRDTPGSVSASTTDQNELRHLILEHMAQGKKDEQIAHRLGLSVRTCRRHIAAIMDELGARSRFQAGFVAARESLR